MKSILKLLANKYSITLVLFVLYNLFVNSIDIPFIVSSRWELHELRNQAETVKQENERVKEQLKGVKAKGYTLEKIAREQYFMKRSNEDVFVFKVAK
ncbi:MAG: FtsB family cell division protein [Bacteroidota bacterium]